MSLDTNTFRWELKEARRTYEAKRAEFVARFPGVEERDILESQTRGWLLDDVVRLLGWRVMIVPEAPVEAPKASTEKRWFLDYLGYEVGPTGATVPLMVVEAKRPSEPEPKPMNSAPPYNAWSPRDLIAQHLLGQTCLSKTWVTFVEKAEGYLRRIHTDHGTYPVRYVITNGDWFVLFLRPKKALIDRKPESSEIVVYVTWDEFVDGAREVLRGLHRRSLLSEEGVSSVSEGEIGAVLARQGGPAVLLRSLEVVYRSNDDEIGGGAKPSVLVWPSAVLRTAAGRWYVVVDRQLEEGGFQVPMRAAYLRSHLVDVAAASNQLLVRLQSSAGVTLPSPRSAHVHARDPDALASVPLVTSVSAPKSGSTRYRILVGEHTHFLLPPSNRCSACAFHDVAACPDGRRVADPYSRSVSERAFFRSGEGHGCFHLTAWEARVSGEDDDSQDARCHLWAVETGLCCRTCSFEAICFSAAAFAKAMPCPQEALSQPDGVSALAASEGQET